VKRKILLGTIAVLLVAQGVLQRGVIWNQWKTDYSTKETGLSKDLDPAQMVVAMMGLREFVAGILWVRADSFFDEGNYDAVLPIIRLVTWLDPHQVDVYATGMWHIGYNFTDTEQRSDRRYIPVALAFGEEGANNNSETYELYFETGWLWYHKIDDNYGKAVKWWEIANTRKDMIPARKNLLANAYYRNGQIEEALDKYFVLFESAHQEYIKNPAINLSIPETIERNIDNNIIRMVQRGYIAKKKGYYDQGDYDTKPPFDVGFSVKATVEEPSVINFEGTWNVLPVGTRIRVVLKDEDLSVVKVVNGVKKKVSIDAPGGMIWDNGTVNFEPPRDMTFMQDGLFVRNRRFSKRVDMSNDRNMYPFKSKSYVLEFYYNPRSAPPHIQDKFGWNGEGMTDANFLNTSVRPGQRVVFARLKLDRDQILRRGQWVDVVPHVQTPNYVEVKSGGKNDDIFIVPPMRSEKSSPSGKGK
jgi:tetratricopeptide (TPR) repeat protein